MKNYLFDESFVLCTFTYSFIDVSFIKLIYALIFQFFECTFLIFGLTYLKYPSPWYLPTHNFTNGPNSINAFVKFNNDWKYYFFNQIDFSLFLLVDNNCWMIFIFDKNSLISLSIVIGLSVSILLLIIIEIIENIFPIKI